MIEGPDVDPKRPKRITRHVVRLDHADDGHGYATVPTSVVYYVTEEKHPTRGWKTTYTSSRVQEHRLKDDAEGSTQTRIIRSSLIGVH